MCDSRDVSLWNLDKKTLTSNVERKATLSAKQTNLRGYCSDLCWNLRRRYTEEFSAEKTVLFALNTRIGNGNDNALHKHKRTHSIYLCVVVCRSWGSRVSMKNELAGFQLICLLLLLLHCWWWWCGLFSLSWSFSSGAWEFTFSSLLIRGVKLFVLFLLMRTRLAIDKTTA